MSTREADSYQISKYQGDGDEVFLAIKDGLVRGLAFMWDGEWIVQDIGGDDGVYPHIETEREALGTLKVNLKNRGMQ